MLRTLSGHLTKNVVAYLALFVALGGTSYAALKLPKNSVGSGQIKNGAVAKRDLARAVRTQLTKAGVPGATGPQGLQGQQGQQGQAGGRGPSFGDGKHLSSVANFACDEDFVVGSQTLTVTEPSRIWVHGHGTVRDNGAAASDYGLSLQLRDAGDTATLAVAIREWDSPGAGEDYLALSSGGLMLSGDDPDLAGSAFVAPAGTYILQLTVNAGGACTDPLPDFGFNGGSVMGYVLLGTG
jgi:hypothetical protein